jgi:hypothetical protein
MIQQPLTVFNFKKNTSTEHFYLYIQGVSGGTVNILGGGSIDYSR